jgi:hypothetical protein
MMRGATTSGTCAWLTSLTTSMPCHGKSAEMSMHHTMIQHVDREALRLVAYSVS